MPDYYSPDGPPPFKQVDCDNLFEVLMSKVDKPHEHMHIIAELLCKALHPTLSNLVEFVDGVPMLPDPNRGKTLSIARALVQAGTHGNNKSNQYLKMGGDIPGAGLQGMLLPRKATITGIWAKSRSTSSWTVEAHRNGVSLSLASALIVSGKGSATNVDIDLDSDDWLQIYASGSGIDHPIAAVEIAWRK